MINFRLLIIYLFYSFILTGCAGCPYSFTGASLPAEYKSVYIPIFDDVSGKGELGLRENITDKLRNKFISDNTLKISDLKSADTSLEGLITAVSDEPSTISGNEKVNTRRITVAVRVVFQNLKTGKKIWEKSFSNWGDYDASGGGIANRQTGFQTAIEKLTEDILIGTVSDW